MTYEIPLDLMPTRFTTNVYDSGDADYGPLGNTAYFGSVGLGFGYDMNLGLADRAVHGEFWASRRHWLGAEFYNANLGGYTTKRHHAVMKFELLPSLSYGYHPDYESAEYPWSAAGAAGMAAISTGGGGYPLYGGGGNPLPQLIDYWRETRPDWSTLDAAQIEADLATINCWSPNYSTDSRNAAWLITNAWPQWVYRNYLWCLFDEEASPGTAWVIRVDAEYVEDCHIPHYTDGTEYVMDGLKFRYYVNDVLQGWGLDTQATGDAERAYIHFNPRAGAGAIAYNYYTNCFAKAQSDDAQLTLDGSDIAFTWPAKFELTRNWVLMSEHDSFTTWNAADGPADWESTEVYTDDLYSWYRYGPHGRVGMDADPFGCQWVAYEDTGTIYLRRMDDESTGSWQAAVTVDSSGTYINPAVCSNGRVVMVTAQNGSTGALYQWLSVDQGTTFTGPTAVT